MSATTRKDYGANAIVPPSNEVLKRINSLNSPYSFQATGHNLVKGNYIPPTSENLDALTTGTRVLYGNQFGVVTEATVVDDALTEAVVTIFKENTQDDQIDEIEKTYTKEQLMNAGNLFLVAP